MSQEQKKPVTRAVEPKTETATDQIRQRAYQLYEARGREDGHEQDDWLQAEVEILAVQRRAIAA